MAEAALPQTQKRRSVLAVTTVVFVDALGFSLVLAILPFVASRTFGASQLVIGLLVAAFPFCQLVAAPYLGRLSDVRGRRPVLVLTMAGAALGFFVMASAQWVTTALQSQGVAAATTVGLAVLFLARVINGLTGGNLPVAQAYLADVTTPDERAEAMGGITTAFALAYGIGPAIAGHLASDGSLLQPALLGCGIALLGTLLVHYLLPETRPPITAAGGAPHTFASERDQTLEEGVFGEEPLWNLDAIQGALRSPATGRLLLQWSLFILCFSMFAPMFSLIAGDAYGVGLRTIGLLLSFFAVLAVVWQILFLKPVSQRLGDHRMALAGLLTFLACFALLAVLTYGPGPHAFAGLVVLVLLFGLGFAATRPALTSALSRAVPENQVGGIMGVQQSLDSASTVAGPLVAAALLQFLNVAALGLVAAVFSALAVYLSWRDVRP